MTIRNCVLALVLCALALATAAADERTVWKYDKGTFEKVGDKWVRKEGGAVVREYTEKPPGKTPSKSVQLEDKGKESVTLLPDKALVVSLKEKRAETLKGEWAAATPGAKNPKDVGKKDDPKGSGKFTEVVALKRTGAVGSYALAPSPDGKQVALVLDGTTREVGLLDLATGKAEQKWQAPYLTDKIARSADGKTVVGATLSSELNAGKPSQVFVWDAATGEARAEFEFAGIPSTLATSADCKIVAAAGYSKDSDGLLKVWDAGTKKELLSLPVPFSNAALRIGMTDNGKVLAVSGTGPMKDQVSLVDLPSGKLRTAIKCRPEFALSGDGSTLAEWFENKDGVFVNVWNTKTPRAAPRVIKLGRTKADSVAFLNGGKHLAVGGGMTHDDVRVFDLKTLAEFDSFKLGKPLTGGTRRFTYVRATPDGTQLLTYGSDYTIRVWSTPFGEKKGKDDAPAPKQKSDK